MKLATLDKLIWALIFSGMALFTLGLFMQRGGSALGGWVAVAGGLAAAVGVVLIFIRARKHEPGDSGS